jgi:putative transposase
MTIPPRGRTGHGTYFISTQAASGANVLQSDRIARLLIDVLYSYRAQQKYFLHEFVVMPNHLHLLIAPRDETTLEKSMQLIKGGFSYRAKKELKLVREIWQTSFHDRRVRDAEEYEGRRKYLHHNPVEAGLVMSSELWEWSSASGKYELDPYLSG